MCDDSRHPRQSQLRFHADSMSTKLHRRENSRFSSLLPSHPHTHALSLSFSLSTMQHFSCVECTGCILRTTLGVITRFLLGSLTCQFVFPYLSKYCVISFLLGFTRFRSAHSSFLLHFQLLNTRTNISPFLFFYKEFLITWRISYVGI